MLTMPSFTKSLIVEQFQGNYLKDAKFRDLYEIIYFSFPSAMSLHTSNRAQFSFQRMSLFIII